MSRREGIFITLMELPYLLLTAQRNILKVSSNINELNTHFKEQVSTFEYIKENARPLINVGTSEEKSGVILRKESNKFFIITLLADQFEVPRMHLIKKMISMPKDWGNYILSIFKKPNHALMPGYLLQRRIFG